MTGINFYRIEGNLNAALKLACQLTEKAYNQGLTVLIHTDDPAQAEEVDELLWSFKPESFLPHQKESLPAAQIAISDQGDPGDHHGLLINLAADTPPWFSRFEKTVEIVYDEPQIMALKREQFGFYKSRGYPLNYYDLTKS